MQINIVENVLQNFNRQTISENRKVILFIDNTTVHPEAHVGKYRDVKVVFFPKNNSSCLQPLDAGIIQSFKVK